MKTEFSVKKPFGTTQMVRVSRVRYLPWEDAFDVEFDDGLSFLEPHAGIRKACGISLKAMPVGTRIEPTTRLGIEIRYDTGELSEISWEFIREAR